LLELEANQVIGTMLELVKKEMTVSFQVKPFSENAIVAPQYEDGSE